jgi:NAD(P)-dependent dehydrogenase (short-subunit alcohol dehydrogenase family)
MRLENKVALITGAGSGIGRATAELFAKEGARVVVADYNAETAQSTVGVITQRGGQAVVVQADVSKAADAERMVKATLNAYGRLDIIHNNAGIFVKPTPAHELTEEVWDHIFNINIKGVWLGCKYAIPELIKAGAGAIVNTASMAGLRTTLHQRLLRIERGGRHAYQDIGYRTRALQHSGELYLPRRGEHPPDSPAWCYSGTSRRPGAG